MLAKIPLFFSFFKEYILKRENTEMLLKKISFVLCTGPVAIERNNVSPFFFLHFDLGEVPYLEL